MCYAEEGGRSLRRFVLKASLVFSLPMLVLLPGNGVLGRPSGDLALRASVRGQWFGCHYFGVQSRGVGVVAFSFSRALFAIERADVDFVVNFAALFIMLTLGLWLVRALGPLGAALGLLVASLAILGARVGAFLRLGDRIRGPQVR